MNYRTGGVDIFAGVNYDRNTSLQVSDMTKNTYGVGHTLLNQGDLRNEYSGSSFYGNAGVNWQIADYHYLGGKLEWGKTLGYDVRTTVNDNVFLDGTLIDKLTTVSDDTLAGKGMSNLGANIYYNGLVAGKLGIDVNFDYYGTASNYNSESKENSSITEDRSIHSSNGNDARLYAAKAVLSYPVWKGPTWPAWPTTTWIPTSAATPFPRPT